MEDIKKYWPDSTKTPRPGQLEAARDIVKALETYDWILLNAPPGSGKSLIAMTVANALSAKLQKSYALTPEKILQKQYIDSFKHLENLTYLSGKNNYLCTYPELEEETVYEEGICHLLKPEDAKKLPCYEGCQYRNARDKAKVQDIVISNYHYMAIDKTMLPFTSSMPQKELTIFDEAHNTESILLDFSDIKFSRKESINILNRLVKVKSQLPAFNYEDSLFLTLLLEFECLHEDDVDGAVLLFQKLKDIFENLSERILKEIEPKMKRLAEEHILKGISKIYTDSLYSNLKSCKNFCDSLTRNVKTIESMLKSYEAGSPWIYTKSTDEAYELKSLYSSYIFKDSLGKLSTKYIFMSGTLADKDVFCRNFNISSDKVKYLSIPSSFPIEIRKVYNLGVANLSYSNVETGILDAIDWVDALAEVHKNDRILVHTANYNIAVKILEKSKFKDRMLIPFLDNREATIEKYKETEKAILVSPSLMEGISLDYDLCRAQIFVKVPYLSLGDKRTRVKAKIDPQWYLQEAVNKVVQGCMRGVRHADDSCTTYLIDSCFIDLFRRADKLIPKWFKESIKTFEEFTRDIK